MGGLLPGTSGKWESSLDAIQACVDRSFGIANSE